MLKNFIDKRLLLGLLILFILCAVAYGNSFTNGFVMNDYGLILENSAIHHFKNIPLVFSPADSVHPAALAHYRPVSDVFRIFLFGLLKTNPYPYHVVNVLLFYFYCVLVFVFLRKNIKDQWLSLLATMLFCVHPMNTITVNYIAAQEVLLFGLFAMSSLIFLCSAEKGKKFYVLSLLSFLLAVLTQEIMMILPCYIFLILWFLKKYSFKKAALWTSPYIALAFLYIIFRWNFVGIKNTIGGNTLIQDMSFLNNIASLGDSVSWSITKLIFPKDIVLFWSVGPVVQSVLLKNIIVWTLAVLMVILLGKVWKKGEKSFWLLWFLLGFLPVLWICCMDSEKGFILRPHWLFLSSLGFFVLIAHFFNYVAKRIELSAKLSHSNTRKLKAIVVISLVIVLGSMVRENNALWKDEKTYAQHWLSIAPDQHSPNFWLAHAYLKEKDYVKAKVFFEQALTDGFIDWQVYANLGLIAKQSGDYSLAQNYFQRALNFNPQAAIIYNNLGVLAIEQNDYLQAERFLNRAIDYGPYIIEPRLNLAGIYKESGRINQAIRLCEENLSIHPNEPRTMMFLIELYLMEQENDKVLYFGQKVLKQNRDVLQLTHLGSLFAQHHLTNIAFAFYFKALELEPWDKNVHLEMGKLYGNLGDFNRAISLWQDGLRLDPDDQRFSDLIRKAEGLRQSNP